jgi:hypothetical protein
MKRFTAFISIILAINIASANIARSEDTPPAPANDAGDPPNIQVDRMVYDFGEVSGRTKVEGKFVITNTGGGVLELQQPKPTCGCTVAQLSKDKLARGESSELPFTMNINPAHGGVMEKFIGLTSNDPDNGTLRLSLKVNVKPLFAIEPTTINLGDLTAGTATNLVITMTRLDDKPLDFKNHQATTGLTTRVEPVEESNGKSVRVHADFKADGAPRNITESIALFTNDSSISQPVASVHILGRLVGDITVSPEKIIWSTHDPANWPGPRGKEMARRPVTIKRSAKAASQPLEIKSVKTNLENIKVTVNTKEEGQSYEVELILEKAPTESINGMMTIETNFESISKLEVPIHINIYTRRPTAVRPPPPIRPAVSPPATTEQK